MDVVIFAGGTGTRLKEMTELIPKPLLPIGGKPMVYHVMQIYSYYGYTDFILALGYKQELFKEYFSHFNEINNDVVIYGDCSAKHYPNGKDSKWKVTLSNTGANTLKGGRLKRIEKYVHGDTFMCTYGDGVADIDIPNLLAFHNSHGKIVTMTGVRSMPRFGEIYQDRGELVSFTEKQQHTLINGGFYVFNRRMFDYLSEDTLCDLEVGALEKIAKEGELMVYKHNGYWGCVDTLCDMGVLQNMCDKGDTPWLRRA